MPELPDVAALTAFLDDALRGRRITAVTVASFSALKTATPPVSALVGHDVEGVERRAKLILLRTTGPMLLVHLFRAGWVRWYDTVPATQPRPGKGPIVARVATGECGFDLTEAGTQRRVALWVATSQDDLAPLAERGPDALELAHDPARFAAALAASRSRLKTWLTEQQTLAGIGNGYSDEIAFAARLSPFASVARLAPDVVERLREATVAELEGAQAALTGLPPHAIKAAKKAGWRVHGRDGQPCPVCGTPIASVSYTDSSFQYCPGCQTGGKPLADRTTSRFLK